MKDRDDLKFDLHIQALRQAQAERVMPLIGRLLDGWDGLSNDVKSDVTEDSPAFANTIEQILKAMEG